MTPWRDEVIRRLTRRLTIERDGTQEHDAERCRRDFLYFYRCYGWMYDPDAAPEHRQVPCLPWASQVEFIAWMVDRRTAGEDAFLKKSRKIGISWTVLLYFAWCFLFERSFRGLIGSRVEKMVDNRGDLSALFPKLRWILSMLPEHLKPAGDDFVDVYLKLQNKAMDTVITGESTNLQFGAAGRVGLVFIDEAGRVPSPMLQRIWESTESVGPRLLVFNATYSRGHFAEHQMSKLTGRMCKVMDWRADPRRPDDFPVQMTVPIGSLTRPQFDLSYGCKSGAGRLGAILSLSEAINGYRDSSPGFDPAWRKSQHVVVAWDFGSGYRKLVCAFLMLELGPEPTIRIDKVIPWGAVPFYDPRDEEETVLTRVDAILEREYGGPAAFHTGDASGSQRDTTQMGRIEMMKRRGWVWHDQQAIVDPWDEGGDEVFHVNHTPWKEYIVETETQPMLNSGHLLIHAERAAEAMEAGQEWSWKIPGNLTEHEAQRLDKAHHKMEKTAVSDIAEPCFLYGVHGVLWYLKALRAASTPMELPPPPSGAPLSTARIGRGDFG